MEKKEKNAIITTVVFILFSLLTLWILNYLKIQGDITYTAILLLPLLLYIILAEKVKSFKVGDFEATFKEIANQKIKVEWDSIKDLTNESNLDIIQKGTAEQLQTELAKLKTKSETQKIILTLELGKGTIYYDQWAVQNYLKSLSPFRNFRFIAMINKDKTVIAFISKDKLLNILDNYNLGSEFIRLINEGDENSLNIFPGIIMNKITNETKNIDALKEMERNGIDQLLVVDSDGKLKGIIEREDLLSKLILALADA